MKFRSKPVVIEAVQWNKPGDHIAVYSVQDDTKTPPLPKTDYVNSKQGPVKVNAGDWIITETDGSGHYPCAPDVFEAKYERT